MADEGHHNGATLQDVWAMLHELSARQRETDRRVQEMGRQMQEMDRRLRQSAEPFVTQAAPPEIQGIRGEHSARWREIDREMQETDRRLQQTYELFVSEWDTLIEALAKRDLIPLLNSRGIEVDYVSRHHKRNYGGRRWEIDIVTVSSREVLAVLVRTTLKRDGVDEFLDTLRHVDVLMREYAGRAIYGAVAYLQAEESADAYAERHGLFVIRATGSSTSITNHENFRPRTFGRGVRSSGTEARS